MYRILCLNFGSTSTKMALFEDDKAIFTENFTSDTEAYPRFPDLVSHEKFAKELIKKVLADHGFTLADIDIFAARGGAQVFIESGAFPINEIMYEDTNRIGGQRHPGKLATRIAHDFSLEYGKEAYVVNVPSVDEFDDISRITGLSDVYRASRIHTLNQKEVAYRYAKKIGKNYKDLNLIVCHIGGGISVTAHKKGRMVDSNDIIEGDGPMTPTRSGALPLMPVIEMAYSGKYEKEELIGRMVKKGGLLDHLGCDDMRKIEVMIKGGDEYAKLVVDSMIYQIAKYAGSMAVTLGGKIDAIIFTGGLAKSAYVVEGLKKWISWLGQIEVIPGEFEMEALAAGVLRVKNGEEEARTYTGESVWNCFKRN